jgi:hypothetical protein
MLRDGGSSSWVFSPSVHFLIGSEEDLSETVQPPEDESEPDLFASAGLQW